MLLREAPQIEVRVELPERSVLVMAGAARHVWKHGIKRGDVGTVTATHSEPPQSRPPPSESESALLRSTPAIAAQGLQLQEEGGSSRKRGTRVSITFRELAAAFLPGGDHEEDGRRLVERAALDPDDAATHDD